MLLLMVSLRKCLRSFEKYKTADWYDYTSEGSLLTIDILTHLPKFLKELESIAAQ